MRKLLFIPLGLILMACPPQHLECITTETDVYDSSGIYQYTEVSKEQCYYTN